MLEKYIEMQLCTKVRKMGGMCIKLSNTGIAGIPDRLVLLPKGKIGFVEVKRPGQKLRPMQLKRRRQLENLGFTALCLDEVKWIDGVIRAFEKPYYGDSEEC